MCACIRSRNADIGPLDRPCNQWCHALLDHKAACFKLWCVVAACPAGQPGLLVVVLNTFRYSRYLLVPERNAIHLVLHAEAQPRDMVQAYLQVRETLAPACSNYRTQGEHQAVPYQYHTVMACCWTLCTVLWSLLQPPERHNPGNSPYHAPFLHLHTFSTSTGDFWGCTYRTMFCSARVCACRPVSCASA